MNLDQLSPEDQQLLAKFRCPYAPGPDEQARFIGLKERGFVSIHQFKLVQLGELGNHMAPDTWIITPAGEDALLQFEDVRRQEAQNKRFQTRQEKIAIAAIFASFLIFALGFIIKPDTGLISGLAEFLGRWIK